MSAAGPKKELYEATSAADLLRLLAEKIEALERDLVAGVTSVVRGAPPVRVPQELTAGRNTSGEAIERVGRDGLKPHYAHAPGGQPVSEELRECEGCGQRKPLEEMAVCFLPGTGESYQCEECRGAP